jgi:hypothetical protein
MTKSLLLGTMAVFMLSACERLDPDVFFAIGNNMEYTFNDIELYDTSTHIIYFRKVHDEFTDIDGESFSFLDNGDPIYTGKIWPPYTSTYPSGHYIMSDLSVYGNYALKIEYGLPDEPDLRNDPRIIDLLNQHGLLHSGLAISSVSTDITDTQISFTFSITNQDQSDLLIIDPDKTGANLFHFYTNGLFIYDQSDKAVFISTIQPYTPDPWNSWESEWLTDLKSGESKEFTIDYPLTGPISPGNYYSVFSFPGLTYQVSRDQLYQEDGRIWLGDVTLRQEITVE